MPFSIKLNHPHAMTCRSQVARSKRFHDYRWYCQQHNKNYNKICDRRNDMSEIEFRAWTQINVEFLSINFARLNAEMWAARQES